MAELYHHGVIGMKCGIRRIPEQLGYAPKDERKTFKKQLRADEKQWQSQLMEEKTSDVNRKRYT